MMQWCKMRPHKIKIPLLLLVFCLAGLATGKPVSRLDAEKAGRGWLKQNAADAAMAADKTADRTGALSDADGRTLCYVIPLHPRGFMILSADDDIEPVVAFSATGHFLPSEKSPLNDLLNKDMKARLDGIGLSAPHRAGKKSNESNKWEQLLRDGSTLKLEEDEPILSAGSVSVGDIRVAPLLQSKWGQGDAAGGRCYNYYTNFGTSTYYPTGCVATAMAQLMRYHSWPTTGIGVHWSQITVDGGPQWWNTRGGNGSGGAYNWSQMPYNPEAGLTTTQRQAIGALCYDAGLMVKTGYTDSGSGASSATANQALKNTFGYANSIYGYGFSSSGDAGLWNMTNANLDAGLPVVLGISGPGVAHAVVADGYGYTSSTMYHHLNMGWEGLDDAWYHLPTIDVSPAFNAITDCIYNIYPTGSGEIISGRITSLAGAAMDGVIVTAYLGSTQIKQTSTNSRGIYALKNLSSGIQYRLSAVKAGSVFLDRYITTGLSQDWNAAGGNKWGVNFAATNAAPPTAISKVVDVNSLSSLTIGLEALDDHLPNPPAKMTYTITSLPAHGTLSAAGGGQITSLPYTLLNDANTVVYTPCPYYGGQDSFQFKANDGGTAPSGGDSNIATITLNVDKTISSSFGLDGNMGNNAMIDTTYYASRSQALYLASDIGSARYLTDLAIQFTIIPPISLKQWTIRLQHTNMTYYADVVADFLTSGWTQVYQADVTVSQTGWVNFHFAAPFYYNGTQNLLVDFSFNNTSISGSTGWYLFYNVDGNYDSDRMITIKTDKVSHTSPLTWDFWYGDGYYWGGDWLPSIKWIGDVPITPMKGDFDLTCDVRLPDLAIFSAAWMTQQGNARYNAACDISTPKDNAVNLADLRVFAERWLTKYQP